MVKYLIPWHCEFENVYCLQAAKINFDRVKNGEIDWNGINVNIRTFSLNFGLREGDEDDFNWIEGQMLRCILAGFVKTRIVQKEVGGFVVTNAFLR